MALLHNVFMRGFNSIYNQALEVQPQDYKPFLCYAQCIYETLDAHHSGEETKFFPRIEEATGVKGIMDVNITQHGKDLLSPKSKLCTYLNATY
jgi:hemerythrin superfamily protein